MFLRHTLSVSIMWVPASRSRLQPCVTKRPTLSGASSKVIIIHCVGGVIPQAQAGIQPAHSRFTAEQHSCICLDCEGLPIPATLACII